MTDRIEGALVQLGKDILSWDEKFAEMSVHANAENGWFTQSEVKKALNAIAKNYLDANKLSSWATRYDVRDSSPRYSLGLILAGNLPAVGFHDVLCGLVNPCSLKIKLSHKDSVIIPFLLDRLWEYMDIDSSEKYEIVERLESFDAVIATGSDHSTEVFKKYFSGVPSIIRGHRNSLAVLDGAESEETQLALGNDVFDYYGMGCRSVSKVFVPKGFEWSSILGLWEREFAHLADHHKYRNNYDYNLALYLLNKRPHLVSNNLVLVPDESLTSRLACLHYEEYFDLARVKEFISLNEPQIQCVVSESELEPYKTVLPGRSQSPSLYDYADNIDTMEFLRSL